MMMFARINFLVHSLTLAKLGLLKNMNYLKSIYSLYDIDYICICFRKKTEIVCEVSFRALSKSYLGVFLVEAVVVVWE